MPPVLRPYHAWEVMEPQESFLIARARRGDPSAFEEIVRLYQRRVYGVALRIVRAHDVADDVTQEAFLRACRGEPISETPIWIMRQAGRYLPEYRALREKHSFLDACRVPEVCAEVTAQPIERFGLDAAILFQDILIPLM